MAALLTQKKAGGTANVAAAGATRIIASGNFANGANVVIELAGDALTEARVHTFDRPGAVELRSAALDTITATVEGGDADTLIDVSVTDL